MAVISIDSRGIVYLGPERYMAGTHVRGRIVSWLPGAHGLVDSLDALVTRWDVFRADPRYETIVNPVREACSLSDAEYRGAPNVGFISREKLRARLGRNEKQSARALRSNANRKGRG